MQYFRGWACVNEHFGECGHGGLSGDWERVNTHPGGVLHPDSKPGKECYIQGIGQNQCSLCIARYDRDWKAFKSQLQVTYRDNLGEQSRSR